MYYLGCCCCVADDNCHQPDQTGEPERTTIGPFLRRTILGSTAGAVGASVLGTSTAAADSQNTSEEGPSNDSPDWDRVDALINEMTIDEKIRMVHGGVAYQEAVGYIPPIERLGIPEFKLTDGPLGVREPLHITQNEATAFPATIAAASTWDPALIKQEGAAMGRETLAKDLDVLLAPANNITRVPVNGRAFEYFSEDPYLSSRMTVAYADGVQSEGVIATAKHYAANNQEKNRGGPDDDIAVSANVSERALREIYLPSFKAAVQEADIGSIMAAYNRVNGQYAAQNEHLLTEILKEDWGFDGYVVSDWGATHDAVAAAQAGLDLEMPGEGVFWATSYYDEPLRNAVEEGTVSEETLNGLARRVLGQMERFGILDGNESDNGELNSEDHRDLTRTIAQDGAVLLRNEDNALPINTSDVDSIAVIGPESQLAKVGGGGSSDVEPFYTVDPLSAIQEYTGGDITVTYEPSGSQAIEVAEQSDVALMFAKGSSAEGTDRDDLILNYNQNELISKVAAVNDRTIVVLRTGGPIIMPWLEDVASVLQMWYPGQEDGNATAAILFGEKNPSGRLPVTFGKNADDYPANDPAEYPGVNDEGLPSYPVADYDEGVFVGYRWFDEQDIDPLFPFGYGLTYTTFEYGTTRVTPSTAACGESVTVRTRVKNVGDRAGATVVQLYVRDRMASVDRPPKELKAFEKVRLDPGEATTVTLELDQEAFSFYSESKDKWVIEPGKFDLLIGRSSREIERTRTVTLTENPDDSEDTME